MIIFGREVTPSQDILELDYRIKLNLLILQDLSRKDYKAILERYVMLVKMLEEEI